MSEYVLKRSYWKLFDCEKSEGVLTEKQAKDVLTKNYKETGAPHPMGLKLFAVHPDINSPFEKPKPFINTSSPNYKPPKAKKEDKKEDN